MIVRTPFMNTWWSISAFIHIGGNMLCGCPDHFDIMITQATTAQALRVAMRHHHIVTRGISRHGGVTLRRNHG
jgi:hypothetical protein